MHVKEYDNVNAVKLSFHYNLTIHFILLLHIFIKKWFFLSSKVKVTFEIYVKVPVNKKYLFQVHNSF